MKKNEDNKKLDMMLENIYNSDSTRIFNFCCDNNDVRAEVIRMKKTKKIVALLVATAVGAGGITAVYMNHEKNESVIVEKKIQNYFKETKTFQLDKQFNSNVEHMEIVDDKLYFTSFVNEMNDNKKTAIYNIEEERIYELDMQTTGFIMSMYIADECSYIFYIEDVKAGSETRVCCIDNKTGESIYDKQTGFFGQVISVTQNEEGNIITCGLLSENEQSYFICCEYDSQTFEMIDSVNITERFCPDDEFTNIYVMISDEGYYSFYEDRLGKIAMQKITYDMEEAYLKEDICADMEGRFCGAVISSNGDPVVFSHNFNGQSRYSFNELDKECGDVVLRYDDILTDSAGVSGYLNFSGECDFEDTAYDFIYSDAGILYGYNLSEETRTEIADMNNPGKRGGKYASSGAMYYNDGLVLTEYTDDSESFSGSVLGVADMNGTVLKTIPVADRNEGGIKSVHISENDEAYVLISKNVSDSNFKLLFVSTVLHIGSDGDINDRINLEVYDDAFHDYSGMLVKDDGFVCMAGNHLSFFDSGGNYSGEISVKDRRITQIFTGIDGDYIITESENSQSDIRKIDYENNKLELVSEFEYSSEGELFKGDEENDFYISQSDGIYGYNIAEQSFEEIINWVDSDLEKVPQSFTMNGKDTVLCGESGWIDLKNDASYTLLERVDDETLRKIQSRETITIACDSVPEIVMKKISGFNKSNDNYRITLKEYNKYGYGIANNSALDKLNTELIKGEVPDIVITDGSIDINRYTAMGMFTDLNEFIDSSEVIKREDYFDNIFKLYQTEGHQYQLPLTFELQVMFGKKSVLDETGDLSFNKLYSLSENRDVFYMHSQNDLMDHLIKDNITEFVDFSNYSCDFVSDDFKNLLKVIKNNASDEGVTDALSFENSEKRFVNDKCVLDFGVIRDINTMFEIEIETVGEECLFSGYPSSDKSEIMVSSGYIVGIAEKSAHKDIAWEFVETLLSEEVQGKIMSISDSFNYSIPVSRTAFEKENKVHSGSFVTPLGRDVKIDIDSEESISEEARQRLKDIIKSARKIQMTDARINKIIDEQTELYFNGEQNEDETAENIQKKVKLYLKEIK